MTCKTQYVVDIRYFLYFPFVFVHYIFIYYNCYYFFLPPPPRLAPQSALMLSTTTTRCPHWSTHSISHQVSALYMLWACLICVSRFWDQWREFYLTISWFISGEIQLLQLPPSWTNIPRSITLPSELASPDRLLHHQN